MEFTKEQTLRICINNRQRRTNQYKYRLTTKTKWWCLHCLKEIYVSYKQYGVNSIFCKKCQINAKATPTIAQVQYVMRLKNIQIGIVDKLLSLDENIDENHKNNNILNKNIRIKI